jgi:hypothetical protein
MKFDVFGADVEVVRRDNTWVVFYLGGQGVKRPASDIVIPPHIKESEVALYLADIRHEYASTKHPEVKCLG